MTTLQPPEKARFNLLKQVVDDGMTVCVIVGEALREIKERKFYEAEGFKTFAEFCEKHWQFTKRYCNQLIADAATIKSLPESMQCLVKSEKAARALGDIPKMLRPTVVMSATDGGKKPATAASVKAAAPAPQRPPARQSVKVPRRQPTPNPKPAEAKPCDKTGLEIPVETLPLWQRATIDGKEMLQYVTQLRGALESLLTKSDIAFVEIDFQNDIANLKQVESDVKRAVPYAICATCNGKAAKDCATCKGRGYVSEFFWKQCVPEEIRMIRPEIYRQYN